ncbi:islet cell autoantigen 1-like protein [Thrips palmi]|uniref:Islet cell autoantigen 1-like protein n=1 Tax=Thrips palmi TaxID=161013 RepID=A0A6P9A3D5_THRPL|nr:islet cell autoantigen 1-like protein [Thrips palmi]XP_034251214.1 islet cell autoantigen 1-like protein [Thrips palmi]XP_034251215.1 islet cell autoantigen 1-like protein [Thrips palmi]XP_034251216.1 islet cell autoantigen 1-like protein [Thrips palmi]
MNGYGYSGQGVTADQWNNKSNSAMSKMEHTFWVTKQSVFRKFGKKEDECIVASDAELDAKLELFRSVQDTCSELQRILDKYQERLCNLAQEESAMGRFLKECSKRDQTNAGKAMISVGRALSYSGQQRLALRVPLQRLYHEVETFRQRAIEDTLLNVSAMERQRTEYRAALSWMKNISQELDPDTHKQLEKFRKVQGQVRQSKDNFDRLKLDCLQKVDLLAAARCNMFSHALTLYQQALIQHARRAHRAFGTVANDIKGYQHYEFSVVPELTEESSRLARQSKEKDKSQGEERQDEKDGLLFFDTEYHDDKTEGVQSSSQKQKSDSMQNLLNSAGEQGVLPLIPLDSEESIMPSEPSGISTLDLLASDCLSQLDDVLGNSFSDGVPASVSEEWESLFTNNDSSASVGDGISSEISPAVENSDGFLPSQLLDNFASSLKLELSTNPCGSNVKAKDDSTTPSSAAASSELSFMSSLMANLKPQAPPPSQTTATLLPSPTGSNQSPKIKNEAQNKMSSTSKKDMSAWYDLFADLDPLANPDALDSKTLEEERNC